MSDPHEALHEGLADRYELEGILGEGGMGTVYLARDRRHDRSVAIKTMHPDRTNPAVRKRFEREIAITAKLQHPHILPLLESGVAGETLYYVMPYAEGESVQQRLERDGRIPLEEALRIVREVASGLAYAHAHGVVHRDIKPGNIVLFGGHAVVTDFGIAKAVAPAEGERVTQTGLVVGSPAFMSPELARGEEAVDGRADIYSLGCVLYEMLAGEPPFKGDTPLEMIARSLLEEAPSLDSKVENVPPYVAEAVHAAMAKVPEKRFETAGQFAEALHGGGSRVREDPLAGPEEQETAAPTIGSELQRRKVYRTAVLYAVLAWLLVQVAETTFPYLGFSDWAITLVIVTAIPGFPVALALAWAFDLTRAGIRRSRPEDLRAVRVPKATWRQWTRIGAALALGIGLIIAMRSFLPRAPAEPAGLDPAAARQSIAVRPFINLSADPEHDYFNDGMTADILSQPAKIHDAERAGLVSVGGFSRDRAAFRPAVRQARDEHLEIEEP